MVTRLALALALAAGGCTADVPGDVYFCGPERACPSGLECNDATGVCAYEDQLEPFACSAEASAAEPDDTTALAQDLGQLGCGSTPVFVDGCVDHGADVDHVEVLTTVDCGERPFDVTMRYPVAFAPPVLELVDAAGDTVASASICEELDDSGQARACIETSVPENETMYLKVHIPEDVSDCDGGCRFNRYQLSIR
jgi:hypothetical protein